ncbi:hypothetical protein AB0J72_31180 [Dactylosporangium sp. NPDC049742]|uniref:hypothetical protein n=1 Tax=Dactylosporangium sp. NPDC049742 TaxID=3154737 RepID=UPI00341D6098
MVYGAVTGAGTWIALAMLLGYAWNSYSGPPILEAAGACVLTVVLTGGVWGIFSGVTRSPRTWPHLLVPPFLIPVVGAGVMGLSNWRHPVETTACWVAFAVAAHLLVALGGAVGRQGRAVLAAALVALAAVPVAVQQLAQERWLAAALRDRGLTPVVPVAAGFHVDRVNLGKYTLVMRMADGQGNLFSVAADRPDQPCGGPLCVDGMLGYAYSGKAPDGTTLRPASVATLARIRRFKENVEAD